MAREQQNFETIATRSLKLIEHDPDADKPREVDVDWMFLFARYAQDVSNSDVQELWARVLSSAAIDERAHVSPAALQLLSLLDARIASEFEKFCRAYGTFGGYLFPRPLRQVCLSILEYLKKWDYSNSRAEREFVFTHLT
jgi:Protein of unknown function (DUF2806)